MIFDFASLKLLKINGTDIFYGFRVVFELYGVNLGSKIKSYGYSKTF